MSDITTMIQNYKSGKITFDQLKSNLVSRTYKIQDRKLNQPSDPFLREEYIDNSPHYTDGSWDEVERAKYSGLLTKDEYDQIGEATLKAHGR